MLGEDRKVPVQPKTAAVVKGMPQNAEFPQRTRKGPFCCALQNNSVGGVGFSIRYRKAVDCVPTVV